ncbi:MAG: phosphoribosylformylglycinamidine synthase subunit PurS [bacterium]
MIHAQIFVTLRPEVLDVQGQAVRGALEQLDVRDVAEVRVGKFIEVKFNTGDRAKAEAELEKMCEEMLANPVMEIYRYKISQDGPGFA